MRRTITILLFLASLFIFYLLNHYTGLSGDDYYYKHVFGTFDQEQADRVESISDLFTSLGSHYRLVNGRIFIHGILQALLMSDNKVVFNLFNVLVFAIFQVFLLLNVRQNEKNDIILFLTSFALIWFLLPFPGESMLYMTGTIYMWSSTMFLVFLFLFRSSLEKKNRYKKSSWPLFLAIGLLCGSSHELVSIGFSGAMFMFFVFKRSEFKGLVVPLSIGFIIGTCFIVFSPGNFIRVSDLNEVNGDKNLFSDLTHSLFLLLTKFRSYRAIIVLFILLIIQRFVKKGDLRDLLREQSILFWTLLFSFGFIYLIGMFDPRVFFFDAVVAILLILIIVSKYFDRIKPLLIWIIVVVLYSIFAIDLGRNLNALKHNKLSFDEREREIVSTSGNIFRQCQRIENRFSLNWGQGSLCEYEYPNEQMSWYYDKEFLIFLPDDLYERLKDFNNHIESSGTHLSISEELNNISESGYIIIPVSDSIISLMGKESVVSFVSKEQKEINEKAKRDRLWRQLQNKSKQKVQIEMKPCYSLTYNQKHYLYFQRATFFSYEELSHIKVSNPNGKANSVLVFEMNY